MKRIALFLLLIPTLLYAVGYKMMPQDITIGGRVKPSDSVVLQLEGTDKAFLPTRLDTTQRDALTPTSGMLIFNTDNGLLQTYDGSSWVSLGLAGGGLSPTSIVFADDAGEITHDSDDFTFDATDNVLSISGTTYAQELYLGEDSGPIATDAILQIVSTDKASIFCPVMTAVQRDAISNLVNSMCIYNSDRDVYEYYNGVSWGDFTDDLNRETSVTTNSVVRWDGGGGDDVTDSVVIIDDSGNVTGAISLTAQDVIVQNISASSLVRTDGSSQLTTGQADLTSEVSGVLPIANGGTNSSSTPSNGQLLIGNGTDFTLNTISGTANQIDVTNSSGGITLSTPQDIDTAADVDFNSATLASLSQGSVLLAGASGIIEDDITAINFDTTSDILGITGSVEIDQLNIDGSSISADAGSDITLFTDGNSNQLFLDDGSSWVEIGGNSPSSKLSVEGNLALEAEGELRLLDGAGGEYLAFKAPTTLTASETFTLPDGDGNATQVITTDGNGTLSWSDQAAVSSNSNALYDIGLASSVSGSALIIELKQPDGSSDPSAGNPVRIGFRDSALSNGGTDLISVTSALSATVPSGATLGFPDNIKNIVYVYAINNSGTAELAVSSRLFTTEGDLVSTTALSAASDDGSVMYSTTARSNVVYRLIGKVESVQTTAGTWASSPTKIYSGYTDRTDRIANFYSGGVFTVPNNIQTLWEFSTSSGNNNTVKYVAGAGYTVATGTYSTNPEYQIITPGRYIIRACAFWTGNVNGVRQMRILVDSVEQGRIFQGAPSGDELFQCVRTRSMNLAGGSSIQVDVYQTSGNNLNILGSSLTSQFLSIIRVGEYQ